MIRKILDFLMFVFGFDCDTRRNAVNDNLCDYSGQGRNKYGK